MKSTISRALPAFLLVLAVGTAGYLFQHRRQGPTGTPTPTPAPTWEFVSMHAHEEPEQASNPRVLTKGDRLLAIGPAEGPEAFVMLQDHKQLESGFAMAMPGLWKGRERRLSGVTLGEGKGKVRMVAVETTVEQAILAEAIAAEAAKKQTADQLLNALRATLNAKAPNSTSVAVSGWFELNPAANDGAVSPAPGASPQPEGSPAPAAASEQSSVPAASPAPEAASPAPVVPAPSASAH